MKRLAWVLLVLAGCIDFDWPDSELAKQACRDWIAACREKAIMCGETKESTEANYASALASCNDVIWADWEEAYDHCIPEEMAIACDMRLQHGCGAFTHEPF